jgi:hypothetical protein
MLGHGSNNMSVRRYDDRASRKVHVKLSLRMRLHKIRSNSVTMNPYGSARRHLARQWAQLKNTAHRAKVRQDYISRRHTSLVDSRRMKSGRVEKECSKARTLSHRRSNGSVSSRSYSSNDANSSCSSNAEIRLAPVIAARVRDVCNQKADIKDSRDKRRRGRGSNSFLVITRERLRERSPEPFCVVARIAGRWKARPLLCNRFGRETPWLEQM